MHGGGYSNNKLKLYYLIWMIKIFFYGFKIKKDSVVWALGLETALPLLLSSKVRRYKLVFDDADRLVLLFNFRGLLKKIITCLEKFTSKNVKLHIIPGKARYDYETRTLKIIKNTPSSRELELAHKEFTNRIWPEAKLVINLSGWLADTRGVEHALFLSKQLKNNKDCIFIVCGRSDSLLLDELIKQGNVVYLGRVSNSCALAASMASDLMLTLYDPKIEINKYAESNKWGDAIFTNTAILLNNEIKTADFLREGRVCLETSYKDKYEMLKLIKRCIADRSIIEEKKKNIELLAKSQLFFEQQIHSLLETI